MDARVRVAVEQRHHRFGEFWRQVVIEFVWWPRRLDLVTAFELIQVVRIEWDAVGQQFIKDDAERIQVAGAVTRLPAELFRTEVRRRATARAQAAGPLPLFII